jgi:hypothetical protein
LPSREGKGSWDEPYKSRGLRTVLWAAGGEIPPADPAVSTINSVLHVAITTDIIDVPHYVPPVLQFEFESA